MRMCVRTCVRVWVRVYGLERKRARQTERHCADEVALAIVPCDTGIDLGARARHAGWNSPQAALVCTYTYICAPIYTRHVENLCLLSLSRASIGARANVSARRREGSDSLSGLRRNRIAQRAVPARVYDITYIYIYMYTAPRGSFWLRVSTALCAIVLTRP